MNTFAAQETRRFAAGVCLFAIITAPGIAWSQLSDFLDRELELTGEVDDVQLEYGPQSPELIEPLTALSMFYEEAGNLTLADATIERLLSVIRANYGLYTLDQAPSIRTLIAHERERGNAVGAWELEQGLIRLGLRNPDDLRTATIYREVGDGRIDILRRYFAGELPPEIELGCYYDDSEEYIRAQRRGNRPINTAPGTPHGSGCIAGSRSTAINALKSEAYTFYTEAADIYQRNGMQSSDELRDLLTHVVRTSYEEDISGLGRRAIRYLMGTHPENSVQRTEALIELADWDLLHSREFGATYRDSALQTYEDAYLQLRELGASEASIDALFSPETPVMLPSFAPNLLLSPQTPQSTGHIDIRFVVTSDGKADDIEILDTTSDAVPRSARRDFADLIKRTRFRPMLADGQLTDSPPIDIRWYVNP